MQAAMRIRATLESYGDCQVLVHAEHQLHMRSKAMVNSVQEFKVERLLSSFAVQDQSEILQCLL